MKAATVKHGAFKEAELEECLWLTNNFQAKFPIHDLGPSLRSP